MLQLKKVVVVVDPDQVHQPALDKVATLAGLADFNITLLSSDYTQYLVEGYYFDAIDLPSMRKEFLEERKATLETLAKPLRDAGLNVDTLAIWGHPAYEGIIREAYRLNADLIIRHTRQHSALSRILLTNDDWQLVRCCPMPLLLVKEKPWKEKLAVLAAVDPKHARNKPKGLDHQIISVASDLASMSGGDVFVGHSYSQIPLSGTYLKQAKEEHDKAFNDLLADFDIPKTQQHLMEESPEFTIELLQRDLQADVVVMGAISRSILSDVFIGNTTEKILDFLECDVVVIKPKDFKTPVKLT